MNRTSHGPFFSFVVLARARGRMAWNSARVSTPTQRVVVGLLSLLGLVLFALIAALSMAGLRLAQSGQSLADGLSPAALSLAGQAYEWLFVFLLAGAVPFVAATLFQANDLPLLLTTPLPPRAVVAAKLLDAVVVNASQALLLGLPVLVGLGWAARLSVTGWLWLGAATGLLLIVPPCATALLLLLAARALGMRRVRAVVALVSIALGIVITSAAVLGASRAVQSGGLNLAQIRSVLREGTAPFAPPRNPMPIPTGPKAAPAIGLSPASWAAAMLADTAGGRPLAHQGILGLCALLLAAVILVGLCLPLGARTLTADAFLEQSSGGYIASRAGAIPPRLRPFWGLPTAGMLTKDARYVRRDLILQGQIGTAALLFLVPFLLRAAGGSQSPQDSDLFGALALGMIGMTLYMVTSIVGLSSVGLEGRAAWIVLAAPITRAGWLRAKWLGAFGLSAGLVVVLGLIAWPAFRLSGQLMADAAGIGLCACFALSGVGVGLSGLFPRFIYDNPAHRASVWALTLGFVLASAYVLAAGLTLGGAALLASEGILPAHFAWLLGGALFVLLSLVTGLIPVALAARRLRRYDWDA